MTSYHDTVPFSSGSLLVLLALAFLASTTGPAAAASTSDRGDLGSAIPQQASTQPPSGEDDEVDPNPSGIVFDMGSDRASNEPAGRGHAGSSSASTSDDGPTILVLWLQALESGWRVFFDG